MTFVELVIQHGSCLVGSWMAEAKRRANMSGFPRDSFAWNDIFWGQVHQMYRESVDEDIRRLFPMKKE